MNGNDAPIRFQWLRQSLAFVTICLGVLISVLHFFQFDFLAAVTLVPPWLLLIPALIAIAVSAKAISRIRLVVLVAVTLIFAAMFVEEARSLLRLGSLPAKETLSQQHVRIATLNCLAGSVKSAREPLAFEPDVVLLQESPAPKMIDLLAKEYFGTTGSGLYGGDVSMLVNGSIEPVHLKRESHFVHAVVTLTSGHRFDLVSLRLGAPVFRLDFLSSRFWDEHLQTRRNHRNQLTEVRQHLETASVTDVWIVAGDFNLVGNDGALSAMTGLSDSFFEAGSGWCNTGTSDFPLFRVDQIWKTPNLRCKKSKAFATKNSDHRMVVADMEFLKPKKPQP